MLIRFIVFLIVVYILYRVAKGVLRLTGARKDSFHKLKVQVRGEDLVEDPFCHTHVPVSQAYEETIDGERRYFCSRECCEMYKAKQAARE